MQRNKAEWCEAMRELEEVCARRPTPVEIGLADMMLLLVRKTRHILNGATSSSVFVRVRPVHKTHDILDNAIAKAIKTTTYCGKHRIRHYIVCLKAKLDPKKTSKKGKKR